MFKAVSPVIVASGLTFMLKPSLSVLGLHLTFKASISMSSYHYSGIFRDYSLSNANLAVLYASN
jgi:hypothetical protein